MDTLQLIIVCVTILIALEIIFGFLRKISKNNVIETGSVSVDELISEEKYFLENDDVPYFKRLYKRTWEDGTVEYITEEN